MSYNGSGTFLINTAGQPVVTGTVISSTTFNTLTADLGTGLSTAITKDGQTTTTSRIPFIAGISSTLTTDSTSVGTGSIITSGGVGIAKALFVGTTANIAGAVTLGGAVAITSSSANALAVGLNGATNPAFNVDASTASSATGLNVKSAAAAGGVALSVSSSGSNEALTLNAKGTGTIGIGSVSTGAVTITPATTVTGAATLSSTLAVTGIASFAAGSAAAPAITRTGDLDTGVYFPAANSLGLSSGGTNAVYIDSSQNVGIGTSSPTQKLHVQGYIYANSGYTLLSQASGGGSVYEASNNTGINFGTTANTLQFITGGTTRATIDSSGNLGIGTSSPAYKLDVKGSIRSGLASTTSGEISFFSASNDSQMGLINNATEFKIYSSYALTAGYKPINFYTSDALKMTLDASGNLGIGTTTPAAKLDIAGTGTATTQLIWARGNDSSDFVSSLKTGDAGSSAYQSTIGVDYGGVNTDFAKIKFYRASTTGEIHFFTGGLSSNGTEKMRITGAGVLLVGNTSNAFHTFEISIPNGIAAQVKNTNTTNGYVLDIVSASASGTGWNLLRGFAGSTTNVIDILGNGNVRNTNNSYGALSDVKLKENIVDATPKLAGLMQVKVRNYNLKTDPNHKQLGVIAQELETVFPSMIEETPDRDAKGNDLGTTTKSVKYSVFVPMLIKAMQEQQALIQSLTTRLTALEAN